MRALFTYNSFWKNPKVRNLIIKICMKAYSEILKVLQILLTLPVTTASNERFFSVLKRVKTYMRSTCGDDRLCHLMLMAVEPNLVKSFDLDGLVDDFGRLRPRRYPLFD